MLNVGAALAAYYNEIDPFAAQWLRNLIAAGHIAAGDVDERSIVDVQPDDLRGYDQCHFFAGIGIWSLALRLAGWPDDRPVWTGSCPCPPFSAAGKRQACPCCASRLLVWCPRRTGYAICSDCGHAWLADARHLWPELWRLIAVCRPPRVFGEQVASSEGLVWLSGVRGSLEICRYAVGASDIPAAGCGAPHIRQRLFWVADAHGWQPREAGAVQPGGQHGQQPQDRGADGGMGDAEGAGPQGQRRQYRAAQDGRGGQLGYAMQAGRSGGSGEAHGLDHADSSRCQSEGIGAEGQARDEARLRGPECGRPHGGMAVTDYAQRWPLNVTGQDGRDGPDGGREETHCQPGARSEVLWPSIPILCDDGKARRVPCDEEGRIEPALFPLAHAGTVRNRVGLLRGSGNAISPFPAAEFIAAMDDIYA